MLDAETMFTVATCITGLLGVFLLVVWIQERSIPALAWWGAAYLMGASAVALWGAQDSHPLIPQEAPNALLFIACGLIWSGARLFQGRPVLPLALISGALLWTAAVQIPTLGNSGQGRVIVSLLIIACYTFLTAFELRRERRRDRKPPTMQLAVPLAHGTMFLVPIPLILLLPGVGNSWFALYALQMLLYVVGTAFMVVVMAKERVLLVHKTAAMTDPLTGLYNRRAFSEAAKSINDKQTRKQGSVSVLLFDLDHFKSINDRFGHAIGDDALKLFAVTASANMRADDVIGRLGGEEFAAALPGTASDAAIVAERVRAAFEQVAVEVGGHRLAATVSVGIASAPTPVDMESLLTRADVALYRAKAQGRNRWEIAEPAGVPGPDQAPAPMLIPAMAAR